mgnify:FL=1
MSIWNVCRPENCMKSWDVQEDIRGLIITRELMKEGYE